MKPLMVPFNLWLGASIDTGKQILPWIHIHDLCQIIQTCIENKDIKGVVNAVSPQVITNEEFVKTLGEIMDRPVRLRIPEVIVNALLGEDRASLLLTGAKIQPQRMLDACFEYSYPTISSALQEIVNPNDMVTATFKKPVLNTDIKNNYSDIK